MLVIESGYNSVVYNIQKGVPVVWKWEQEQTDQPGALDPGPQGPCVPL